MQPLTILISPGCLLYYQDIEKEISQESKAWLLDGGSLPPGEVSTEAGATPWEAQREALLAKEESYFEEVQQVLSCARQYSIGDLVWIS
jgi:hypothetical protein